MITSRTDPCSLDGEGEDDAVLEDRHFTAPQALLQNIHQLKGSTITNLGFDINPPNTNFS